MNFAAYFETSPDVLCGIDVGAQFYGESQTAAIAEGQARVAGTVAK